MARQLRSLDRRVKVDAVRLAVEGRREDDVRRALAATRRSRPDDPFAYFVSVLGKRVAAEPAAVPRRGVPAVAAPDDPYGP